jgi:hypothetical protein
MTHLGDAAMTSTATERANRGSLSADAALHAAVYTRTSVILDLRP